MNSRRVLAVALAIGLMVEAIWLVMSPRSDWIFADDGFPDRTPPSVTTVNDSGNEGRHDSPTGSHIELVAPGFQGEWSAVQWQDVNGDWHNVDGWRGTLDEWGTRRWWVASMAKRGFPFSSGWPPNTTSANRLCGEPQAFGVTSRMFCSWPL